jgi:hypothetical protein
VWTSGTTALVALVLEALPAASQAWGDRGALDTLALDRGLADLAAVALIGCAAWGWLALTVTVGEALCRNEALGSNKVLHSRGTPPALGDRGDPATNAHPVGGTARPWRLPGGLRRLVLAGCGVALASGLAQPALGAPAHHHLAHHVPAHHGLAREVAALSGLPLPERAVAPGRSHPIDDRRAARPTATQVRRTVVVRPGDCLWSIAARDLLPGAQPAAIAARWRAIYALNRAAIGSDPDLLEVGQHLVLPARPRKDPS